MAKEHFPEFSDDVAFMKQLIVEQGVMAFPGSVSLGVHDSIEHGSFSDQTAQAQCDSHLLIRQHGPEGVSVTV